MVIAICFAAGHVAECAMMKFSCVCVVPDLL